MAKKEKKEKRDKAGKKAARADRVEKVGKKKKTKVAPVPKGMHTVTANLVFKESAKAIAFYQAAFGAVEVNRMTTPDGKQVLHAELKIGDSVVYVNDESAAAHTVAVTTEHRSTAALQLYVKDGDAWMARAVKAGARIAMPMKDMFWGDRFGGIVDPFGIFWGVSTRIANLTPKQLKKAVEDFSRSATDGGTRNDAAPQDGSPSMSGSSDGVGGPGGAGASAAGSGGDKA